MLAALIEGAALQRLVLYAAMVASCALTAVLDVGFARWTGYDPIHFSVWIIVPIGAFLCGMAACGGGIGIAYLMHIRPTRADAGVMVAMGLACMAAVLFLNYWTYALPDGRRAHDLVDFWRFMDVTTRSAHMRIGRAMMDAGEVGTFGFYQLGFEVPAFLAGGFGAYATILQLPACEACPSFLRKVRETSNGDLPVDQADHLLGMMKGGLEDVQNIVTWRPEKQAFEKRQKRAKLTYRLYECPRCKLEVVTASAMVYDGKAWKQAPSASVRRNLGAGTTLWPAFK